MNDRVMDYLARKIDSRRGGRRDYADERDYVDGRRGGRRFVYEDDRDYEDGHSRLKLTKSEMNEWKHMLENADGSKGAHYDMQQILGVAERHGIHFKDFSEAELCVATNMMYADYCTALKKFIEHDKLLECCVCLAKSFLDDVDAPEASEKLALYYHCIVNA